jgi:CRISPR-associated protein Cas5, subtype I-B/HMARI
MKSIKFTLSGKTAFFKKPEVNAYFNFTYGQIHKMTILGIFGAILGYGGYGQKQWYGQKRWKSKVKKAQLVEEVPEFYEKLSHLKISIVPRNEKGYIPKKVQVFNNSVGYASKEQGGNLIVKEQWLENPAWDIYVLITDDETEKLAKKLLEKECVYMPYLGKNDHPADISSVELLELQENTDQIVSFSCLMPKRVGEISDEVELSPSQEFRYEEKLPIGLNALTNFYVYETFIYTSYALEELCETVYEIRNDKLTFY